MLIARLGNSSEMYKNLRHCVKTLRSLYVFSEQLNEEETLHLQVFQTL